MFHYFSVVIIRILLSGVSDETNNRSHNSDSNLCDCTDEHEEVKRDVVQLLSNDPSLKSIDVHHACRIFYPLIFEGIIHMFGDTSSPRCYIGRSVMAIICAQSNSLSLRDKRNISYNNNITPDMRQNIISINNEMNEYRDTLDSMYALLRLALHFIGHEFNCNTPVFHRWGLSIENILINIQNYLETNINEVEWFIVWEFQRVSSDISEFPPLIYQVSDTLINEHLIIKNTQNNSGYSGFLKSKYEWLIGIESEAQFWKEFLSNESDDVVSWIRNDTVRWTRDNICEYIASYKIDRNEYRPNGIRVLNSGSGPLTTPYIFCPIFSGSFTNVSKEGTKSEMLIIENENEKSYGLNGNEEKFRIFSTDALGRFYANIFQVLGIQKDPPITCDVEELYRCFPSDYFVISHMMNSLDHSYDPIQGIRSLLRVTRVGGYVLLRHAENEGVNGGFHYGLHRWAFTVNSDNNFIIWNPHEVIDVSKLLEGEADVKAVLKPHPSGPEHTTKYVYVDIRKL